MNVELEDILYADIAGQRANIVNQVISLNVFLQDIEVKLGADQTFSDLVRALKDTVNEILSHMVISQERSYTYATSPKREETCE